MIVLAVIVFGIMPQFGAWSLPVALLYWVGETIFLNFVHRPVDWTPPPPKPAPQMPAQHPAFQPILRDDQ
jgi:hypothetical protein